MNPLRTQPHRRYNPLKNQWILVSPQRAQRPWQGQQETLQTEKIPEYDSTCYLCPGNTRTHGEKNPTYTNTFVFPNDFPALLDTSEAVSPQTPFFQIDTVKGTCRVVCFSPQHDLTLAEMPLQEIAGVIRTWMDEVGTLSKRYQWIQVFENKGSLMGCSNPHPHGQIWASNFLPNEIEIEDQQQKKYSSKNASSLLLDYVQEEIKHAVRVVAENDTWVVVVPFWATWPFETLLVPKTHISQLHALSPKEQHDLATIMQQLLQTYDALFDISMPYSMGWHFAPFNQQPTEHWQLHAHYFPPLLRSATVKKFMVGYEMLAEAQRDLTPEEAAQKLRQMLS